MEDGLSPATWRASRVSHSISCQRSKEWRKGLICWFQSGCTMAAARQRRVSHESGHGSGKQLPRGASLALHPFLLTPEAAFGQPVCRLGLASYGQTAITPE